MFRVEVTTPGEPFAKSGMLLGTSLDIGAIRHGSGVDVGVDVEVGVGVDVPHELPIITLMSSRYQPSLETDGSVPRRKRKRTLCPANGSRLTSTGTKCPPVLPVQATTPPSSLSLGSRPVYVLTSM